MATPPGMQPRDPSGALKQMLLQVGVPVDTIKADLAECRDQWRYHIHARSVLIVLDNARATSTAASSRGTWLPCVNYQQTQID